MIIYNKRNTDVYWDIGTPQQIDLLEAGMFEPEEYTVAADGVEFVGKWITLEKRDGFALRSDWNWGCPATLLVRAIEIFEGNGEFFVTRPPQTIQEALENAWVDWDIYPA